MEQPRPLRVWWLRFQRVSGLQSPQEGNPSPPTGLTSKSFRVSNYNLHYIEFFQKSSTTMVLSSTSLISSSRFWTNRSNSSLFVFLSPVVLEFIQRVITRARWTRCRYNSLLLSAISTTRSMLVEASAKCSTDDFLICYCSSKHSKTASTLASPF